jgi:hypothetical protein
MLLNTRRRALGLLLAAGAAMRLPAVPAAFAATAKKKECFESESFGPWKGQASNAQAGARISEVTFTKPCDLRVEAQVAASFEAKLVVYGDPDDAPLPRKFLIKPENRLIVRDASGKTAVDEPLCGNCTDIFDDKVSIVLPLAAAPLLREEKTIEIAIKLAEKDECSFKLDCERLRAALDWASQRKEALAKLAEENQCTPPEGCFITTACCELLGLGENCFELTALRHYRDTVLARQLGGAGEIAVYYELAPLILARLPQASRTSRLAVIYARYILPAALAARFGMNARAHRLYMHMLGSLVAEFAPEREMLLPSRKNGPRETPGPFCA